MYWLTCFSSKMSATLLTLGSDDINAMENYGLSIKHKYIQYVSYAETYSAFLQLKLLQKLKHGVFWDVTPCGPCKNRRFKGTQRLLHQGDKNR
jgi:hypothetical protein